MNNYDDTHVAFERIKTGDLEVGVAWIDNLGWLHLSSNELLMPAVDGIPCAARCPDTSAVLDADGESESQVNRYMIQLFRSHPLPGYTCTWCERDADGWPFASTEHAWQVWLEFNPEPGARPVW